MLKWVRHNQVAFYRKYIRYQQYATNTTQKRTKNLYEVLNVTPQSSQKQIKTAYYRLCVELHPDKNAGISKDPEKFAEVNEAYKVLSDPIAKKTYDRSQQVINP